MVSNFNRFYIIIIISILISGCASSDYIRGRIDNTDSTGRFWNNTYEFITYDKDFEIIRREDLDIFALFFFKVEIMDSEEYILFNLTRYTNNFSYEKDRKNTPLVLYPERIYSIDEYLNKRITLYATSPVLVEKIDEYLLKIIEKKHAELYVLDFFSNDKSKAFIIIVKSGIPIIDLRIIDKLEVKTLKQFLKEDIDMALLANEEGFDKNKNYRIVAVAYMKDKNYRVINYTTQAFNSTIF